jgi:hypothetical protein
MRRSLLISLLLLFPSVGIAQTVDPARSMRTVPAEFFEVVNHYVEIHRVIADSHRPEVLCANDEELQRQTWAFAAAIRETRPHARTGNIFSPAVAEFFRAHIADVGRGTRIDIAELVEEAEGEGLGETSVPEVNTAFPWSAGNIMSPSMLWRLPPLPEELEYRSVRRDLVLLDVRANLVVDVLWNALPGDEGNPQTAAPRRPCDVHPELPACWI